MRRQNLHVENMTAYNIFKFLGLWWLAIGICTSCSEFVSVGAPRTDLVRRTVFMSEATADAAVVDMYHQMKSDQFSKGGIRSFTCIGSLSADDLDNFGAGGDDPNIQQFYENGIIPANTLVAEFWGELYEYIYKANSIIEGLAESSDMATSAKLRFMGEAYFVRAFSHFYLASLFGDVPIVTSTSYEVNSLVQRVPVADVHDHVIADLLTARDLLPDDYSSSNGERVRPNKWVATALLARVYLFAGQWEDAEAMATALISHETMFGLEPDLDNVFLVNSREAIWQLLTALGNINTWEGHDMIFSGSPVQVALSPLLVDSFEPGDKRRDQWIGTTTDGINTFYYPFKYKIQTSTDAQEYSMVLRLAEQYLIRAEARAQLGDIVGAQADLNMIRNRAGLPNTTASTTSTLLDDIVRQRRAEFFVEWGHRWLDLKRFDLADAVLSAVKANWESTDQLYPIPEIQILNAPNMFGQQNPGY